MNKYRKKPIVVEAIQISQDTLPEIISWGKGSIDYGTSFDSSGFTSYHEFCTVTINTSTGTHDAFSGDWIVKGVDGQFYAMPDKTFRQLYEKVEEAEPSPEISW